MGLLLGLFGTSLPDMWSKDPTARGEDKMSTSMMSLELCATFWIYLTVDSSADQLYVLRQLLINLVQDALADLDAVDDIVYNIDALNG